MTVPATPPGPAAVPPVIADERDHMQAALHAMRDAFTDACQSGVPWDIAGQLQATFFDGYEQAKKTWGTALVMRDVLGKHQAALSPGPAAVPPDPIARDELEAAVWRIATHHAGEGTSGYQLNAEQVDAILNAADQYRDWAGDTPEQRRELLAKAVRITPEFPPSPRRKARM